MKHTLPKLPYKELPGFSSKLFDYHHGKHHKAYVDNLNKLIPDTDFEDKSLDDIVKKAGGTIDVCDAYLVDDQGGEIKLTLWGDDIPKVKDGDRVKITNGYTNSFKGEVSLTKGKFGQMEVVS